MNRTRAGFTIVELLVVTVLGALVVAATYQVLLTNQRTYTAQNAQIAASRRTAITEAVSRVSPAVVTVQTETVERVPVDIFEQFMGGRSGQQTQSGIGSGFIIRSNGVIVTNEHVVGGATRISVMLRDGTTYPARLLGRGGPGLRRS